MDKRKHKDRKSSHNPEISWKIQFPVQKKESVLTGGFVFFRSIEESERLTTFLGMFLMMNIMCMHQPFQVSGSGFIFYFDPSVYQYIMEKQVKYSVGSNPESNIHKEMHRRKEASRYDQYNGWNAEDHGK